MTERVYNSNERFALGTQVLTKDKGWKDIRELSENDEIAQYDPDTQEISFTADIELLPVDFRESFIKISGADNYAMQLVSVEHRVLYEFKNSRGVWESKACEAKELYNKLRHHGKENLRLRTFAILPEGFEEILGDKATRFIKGEELEIVEDSSGGETICLRVPTSFLLTRFPTRKCKEPTPVITGNCI